MQIVLIGPPGVGKGTQCRNLIRHLPLQHLSTGDLLRSPSGQRLMGNSLARSVDRGSFAPDAMVIQMVLEHLASLEPTTGVLYDGFPRTVVQAETLESWLNDRGRHLDVVLSLEAAEEVLLQRILARAQRESRADDTAEVVQKRLQVFHALTAPVLDFYRQRDLVLTIDASGTPEQISNEILSRLSS